MVIDLRKCLYLRFQSWGEEECTRHTLRPTPKHVRMVIKDIIHLIRFPLMALKEFKDEVVSKDILNEKEVKEVVKYLEANLTDR